MSEQNRQFAHKMGSHKSLQRSEAPVRAHLVSEKTGRYRYHKLGTIAEDGSATLGV